MTISWQDHPASHHRLAAAAAFIRAHAGAGRRVVVVGASRAAADELVAAVAMQSGGLAGVDRAGLAELATRLALPLLTRRDVLPSPLLGDEAVAARAAFESAAHDELRYFGPIQGMPGFPRALARSLSDLRLAGVAPDDLVGDEATADLGRLLTRALDERRRAGAVDHARLLDTAAEAAAHPDAFTHRAAVLMLDVPLHTRADARFARALLAHASDTLVTAAPADRRTRDLLTADPPHLELRGAQARSGATAVVAPETRPGRRGRVQARPPATPEPAEPVATTRDDTALVRLQRHLFDAETPPAGERDDTVRLFSAPGEGREAVEIARRLLDEAALGVPFDEMAVLVRAPHTYLSLLEHALERAGIPAWYHRGTRRPDPAGRALLALMTCAEEGLSARRFAEYVSLGQVPGGHEGAHEGGHEGAHEGAHESAGGAERTERRVFRPGDTLAVPWHPALDPVIEALVADDERADEVQPEEERRRQARRGESAREVAGTLRAPWRWEDLIVEAAVIGGLDRWRRRLDGLARDYQARQREVASDDPESPRARALARDVAQLAALQQFALPVLADMAAWPAEQSWGDWLRALSALAPRVLAQPTRVLRVLQELAPLAAVGPVSLREVRDVLRDRLLNLTHEPPRRRWGRVFVGTPQAARGRSFRVVFVPGLAERIFPQRIREDALLLDVRRQRLDPQLPRQADRAADERLHLALAVGAARERVHLSYPRLELNESRPRVPSFYVLDVLRAIEGRIPSSAQVAEQAARAGDARLAWPAPTDPRRAIDAFEHDLATIGPLLASHDPLAVKGRARYLYELSPALQRSLTARWMRWHRRQWEPADGLVRSVPDTTAPALARQRLGARPYSLTALQRFTSCPYQFLLSAIYRLAPLHAPAPLQKLDPLTRGDLFHRIQTHLLRRLQGMGMLPLTAEALPRAAKLLEWSAHEVEQEAFDELAPAIERVWRDEMAAMLRDLKIWLEHLVHDNTEWTPERFELSFGLDDRRDRDPHSTAEPAVVDGRFQLRGSIDLVERHQQTGLLRVTDHKTGRNRTDRGHTIVAGGRTLQPVLYGLALEAVQPEARVYAGRLSFCTTAGGFSAHEIPLLEQARAVGVQVLEIIDRGVEHGLLAARPAREACTYCDFLSVCGPGEEQRTRRKDPSRFADLDALRDLP